MKTGSVFLSPHSSPSPHPLLPSLPPPSSSRLEPRQHEKCLKLASELTGEDGQQDAESWYMAFDIASKPAAQAHALLSGTQMLPSSADPLDAAQMVLRSKSKELKGKSAKSARPRADELSVGFALAALAALLALAASLSWALLPYLPLLPSHFRFLPSLSELSSLLAFQHESVGVSKLHVSVAFSLGAAAVALLGLICMCLSRARDAD